MAETVDISSVIAALERALNGPDADAAYAQCETLIAQARRLRGGYRDRLQAQRADAKPEALASGLAAYQAKNAKKRIDARIARGARGIDALGDRVVRMLKMQGIDSRDAAVAALKVPGFQSQLLRQPNFGRASLHDLIFWAYHSDEIGAVA